MVSDTFFDYGRVYFDHSRDCPFLATAIRTNSVKIGLDEIKRPPRAARMGAVLSRPIRCDIAIVPPDLLSHVWQDHFTLIVKWASKTYIGHMAPFAQMARALKFNCAVPVSTATKRQMHALAVVEM